MALSNYSEIQASIAGWLARTDLTSRIPDFIRLAEAKINRELRVREMIAQATGSVTGQTLAVPTGFIEVSRLTLDTATDLPLEYRPIEDAEIRTSTRTSGQPLWFTVLGGNFRFYPSPDTTYTYTLDYYAATAALSDSAPTNWLLTKAPDLYLFGALAEAVPYLLDDARVAFWEGRYMKAFTSMGGAEARVKRSSGPRRMRVLV